MLGKALPKLLQHIAEEETRALQEMSEPRTRSAPSWPPSKPDFLMYYPTRTQAGSLPACFI
jgi:hypothetical protein